MKRKVMIYAYSNFNLGDDLFIKLLCKRYPDTRFFLYAPRNYKKTFRDLKNIKIYSRDTLIVRGINYILRIFNIKKDYLRNIIARKTDASVYIGGSLFMQNENWMEKLIDKQNMYIEGKPFYVLGANFGPYHNNEFYIEYKKMFSKFTDICFRDNYSYELFKELPNVRVADDIIFQLKYQRKTENINENYIVISVIKPSFRKNLVNYDELYYDKIKEIIIHFSERGYHINLMSFCEREGDKEAIEEILKLLSKDHSDNVKTTFYKNNIDEVLEVIANSCFVVATRFHSMILGWLFNKPVFPIVYSEKMTNVIKDISFDGLYVEIKHLYDISPQKVYKSMENNAIDICRQIENSEQHFKELDRFLLNKSLESV